MQVGDLVTTSVGGRFMGIVLKISERCGDLEGHIEVHWVHGEWEGLRKAHRPRDIKKLQKTS